MEIFFRESQGEYFSYFNNAIRLDNNIIFLFRESYIFCLDLELKIRREKFLAAELEEKKRRNIFNTHTFTGREQRVDQGAIQSKDIYSK